VIYQHPLAYLLGLEGAALLRGWAGDHDREFVRARLAEVRRLLHNEALAEHDGVDVGRGDTLAGYRAWSATYDDGRNSLFDADEPLVHEILAALPTGTAVDAACGTGRYAEHLAARGHRVIGVDSSAEMLDRARARVPRHEIADPLPPATPDGPAGDWQDWPWSLMAMLPEAFRSAAAGAGGVPQTIIWHFQRPETR
jgi:hypothetical protein